MNKRLDVPLGFMDLSDILGESTAQAKASHLGVTAIEKGSGLCASWVGQVLRESLGWGQFDGDSNLVPTCTCRLVVVGGSAKEQWYRTAF